MKLSAYLQRIGYEGALRPDLASLQALQHAHLQSVPFENLDVQLGRAVHFDLQGIFDKIVQQRRGGWCYEQNGIFGWVLQQVGFDVTRMSAGVMREHKGDAQLGNHLCLRVSLEQPYLVDVGFSGSLLAPLPLRSGTREDSPFSVRLAATPDGYWRFTELIGDSPFSFDFREAAADEALLATKCNLLQADPASVFVQNLAVKQRVGNAYAVLRGRVLTIVTGARTERNTLDSPAAWWQRCTTGSSSMCRRQPRCGRASVRATRHCFRTTHCKDPHEDHAPQERESQPAHLCAARWQSHDRQSRPDAAASRPGALRRGEAVPIEERLLRQHRARPLRGRALGPGDH